MATTIRSKYKQLVKEAENQRLVQEEENDTDSDYRTNLSESEQEASDQTISDNDVVDVTDITDYNDAETSINENILKKENLPVNLQDLKQVGYRTSLKKLKIVLKLFVKLRVVKKYLNGVVLQA